MNKPYTKKPYTAFLEAATKRYSIIKRMHARGYPVTVIASKFGLSRARVYQILDKP